MPAERVLRADHEGVATLTLNRPDKLNALTADVLAELHQQLDLIANDDSVRCVVLTGAGRSFCAGHDLAAISSGAGDIGAEAAAIDALEDLGKPVIAAIRGHCFTGGLELALGCDLLVAAESARLADTHSTWGLVPVWGMSVRLRERVGLARAKRMMFTGERLTAQEAQAIGLVDQVVPDDALDDAVAALTKAISANSADSNRIIKALLHDGVSMPRREALDAERSLPYGMPDDLTERLATT